MKLYIGFRENNRTIQVDVLNNHVESVFDSLSEGLLEGSYVIRTESGHIAISLDDVLYVSTEPVTEWVVS